MNFADTHTRRSDPDTSRIAAEGVAHTLNAKLNLIRCAMIGLKGPCSAEQIADITIKVGIDYHEVSRRLPDMEKAGQVERTGDKTLNSKGKPVQTWRLV